MKKLQVHPSVFKDSFRTICSKLTSFHSVLQMVPFSHRWLAPSHFRSSMFPSQQATGSKRVFIYDVQHHLLSMVNGEKIANHHEGLPFKNCFQAWPNVCLNRAAPQTIRCRDLQFAVSLETDAPLLGNGETSENLQWSLRYWWLSKETF